MRIRPAHAMAFLAAALPLQSNAIPITYDFAAVDLHTGVEWDIRGSIVVDNDIDAVFAEPYIELGNSIVGGSLSINGVSVGDFESASFSYLFMDGFEDPAPYSANLALHFATNEHFGPSQWLLYTEEFNRAGPVLANDLTDLGAFLEGFDADSYAETVVGVYDSSYWQVRLDLNSEFVAREQPTEVPEPAPVLLLSLGLVAIGWSRKFRRTRS